MTQRSQLLGIDKKRNKFSRRTIGRVSNNIERTSVATGLRPSVQRDDAKRSRTHGIRSQVDDPEEIGVAAAARDELVRHVFPGVQ